MPKQSKFGNSLVAPNGVCQEWNETEIEDPWHEVSSDDMPDVGEEVIIHCKDGMMFFAWWHNNEQDGDYWIVRGPHDIRHYIKTNWVTHWRPKLKKPRKRVDEEN